MSAAFPNTAETSAEDLSRIRKQARHTLDQVRAELLAEREPEGHWVGELAASALSTATAVSAIAAVLTHSPKDALRGEGDELLTDVSLGMAYLRAQQNPDGGFGDTDRSHSNIATSYLVLAASALAEKVGVESLDPAAQERLNQYLDGAGRLQGLRKRYGKDKTFVVPIMNNMAIAGLISWDEVAALPFEAAVFPQSMYRFLRMPVVSYAIPALVAIGQARHFLGRRAFAPIRWIRSRSIQRTLKVLETMQPASGGYLEATPLTAFVVMSLAATRRTDLTVVRNGLAFLRNSIRPDGSWPIDTNLATWVTSLSIHALACDPDDDGQWYSDALANWHLHCQHLDRHPFTGAQPGGWGWTDLSGAVPDSDDTPAALIALSIMQPLADPRVKQRIKDATLSGMQWLLRLQNRNGGWPTFCRGWGKLPFDRSSTDLTAHAIRAFQSPVAQDIGETDHRLAARVKRAIDRGNRFLSRQQQTGVVTAEAADAGAWLPLWFGNQDRGDEANPIYGTAKVLIAGTVGRQSESDAIAHLITNQNQDGGWGGGPSVGQQMERLKAESADFRQLDPRTPDGLMSTVEETALAVEALATVILNHRDRSTMAKIAPEAFAAGNGRAMAAILRGIEFLAESVSDRRHRVAWPIGFYFAKLWYHERLYPLIFTAAALGKFLRATDQKLDTRQPS